MAKFILYLLGYFIYPFSFLFPRTSKLWVFGSYRGGFSDNSKYLYIYATSHYPTVKSVWISTKRQTVAKIRGLGMRAYFIGNPVGLWYALRARFWFYNAYTSDILFFASGGATCVNLWHGVGLKKIEFCIKDGPLAKRYVEKRFWERFYYPQVFRRPDFFLSSNDFQSVKFAEAFRVSKDRCLNLGYPRNEILTMPEADRKAFIDCFEPAATAALIEKTKEYKRVYIYMPTWRDSQKDLFTQVLDVAKLNELMQAQQALLILKPHPNTVVDAFLLKGFSHIVFMDSVVDVYTVLPYTDVLITDYSSILYDYILMDNKSIVLYIYDYEQYVNGRDFNYPFLENVVGIQTHSFEELSQCLSAIPQPISPEDLKWVRERFWGQRYSDVPREILHKVTLL